MATSEQIGKSWYVRQFNGELLTNKTTGKPKRFNSQEMATFTAEIVTNREQNPHPPSWRAEVEEARKNTR